MNSPAKRSPPVVFVVDDDSAVRESLDSLIRSVGLRVETFSSAQEFLRQKLPDAPACLVLDIRMPGRSGLDLQHELAAEERTTPIIFITGHGDIPMSVRAMKAGAVEFLTKPFRDRDLLDAIHQAIQRDQAALQRRADLAELQTRYERSCFDSQFVCQPHHVGCRLGAAGRQTGNRSNFVGWHIATAY